MTVQMWWAGRVSAGTAVLAPFLAGSRRPERSTEGWLPLSPSHLSKPPKFLLPKYCFPNFLLWEKRQNLQFTILTLCVAWSPFALLCTHERCPSPEPSQLPQLKLRPHKTLTPRRPPLGPSALHSAFCLLILAPPERHVRGVVPFSSFCDWLSSLSIMSSRLTHAAARAGNSFPLKAR